jgi:hypothetical protein
VLVWVRVGIGACWCDWEKWEGNNPLALGVEVVGVLGVLARSVLEELVAA